MIRHYGIVVAKPGVRFDYSNLGFIVAGEAVPRAPRQSLRSRIRDDVLLPLGMKHSSHGLDSAMARQAVVPFVYGRGLTQPVPTPDGSSDYLSFNGWASAHDLGLFAAFHMNAHRPDQRRLLSDAAVDSMQTVAVSTPPSACPNCASIPSHCAHDIVASGVRFDRPTTILRAAIRLRSSAFARGD